MYLFYFLFSSTDGKSIGGGNETQAAHQNGTLRKELEAAGVLKN